VFSLRIGLNSYILFRRASAVKGQSFVTWGKWVQRRDGWEEAKGTDFCVAVCWRTAEVSADSWPGFFHSAVPRTTRKRSGTADRAHWLCPTRVWSVWWSGLPVRVPSYDLHTHNLTVLSSAIIFLFHSNIYIYIYVLCFWNIIIK
jgi:hypothetical protein